MPQQVLAGRQLGRDGDRPLGAAFAEEVRCPLRITGFVVPELLDLDPDVAGIAFEGFAIIVGAVCEIARRVGWLSASQPWGGKKGGCGKGYRSRTNVMTGPLCELPH